MRVYFLFFLLGGIFTSVKGQDVLLIHTYTNDYDNESNSLEPLSKTDYYYNDDKQLIIEEKFSWNKELGTFDIRSRRNISYEDGYLLEEVYEYYSSDTIRSIFEIQNDYYPSGNLKQVEKKAKLSMNSFYHFVEKNYYKDNELTELDSIIFYLSDWVENLIPEQKHVYDYNGLDKEIKILWFNSTSWEEVGLIREEYDSRGNQIRRWTNYLDYALEGESITEFDENNNRTYVKYRIKYSENDFILAEEAEYENSYNENQLLILEELIYSRDYNSDGELFYESRGGETRYTYYCDNLLHRKEFVNNEDRLIWQQVYEYDEGISCRNNINFDVEVYPNPFQNELTISSKLLEYSGSIIKVFDTYGRLLKQEVVPSRIDNYILDLTNIPNGSYYIQIVTDDKSLAKKIIKME